MVRRRMGMAGACLGGVYITRGARPQLHLSQASRVWQPVSSCSDHFYSSKLSLVPVLLSSNSVLLLAQLLLAYPHNSLSMALCTPGFVHIQTALHFGSEQSPRLQIHAQIQSRLGHVKYASSCWISYPLYLK
ncbi:hypothetical protein LZ32DRAFT_451457 [Colletotrichum eremochloae]|nr:hypothetical protein LZ32DRAFT_451457 [Colletotrichum eremochloae]